MNVIFTNTLGVPEEYSPKPASALVPEWYKKVDSYVNGAKKPTGEGSSDATVKRCMPVFDAIVGGYIILSAADVYVSQKEASYADAQHFDETGETISLSEEKIKNGNLPKTVPHYEWSSYGLIQFHPIEQMPEHPSRNGHMTYPKWINPWAIKTPEGYSSLFVQPMHRESPFTILPGIVDTDTYTAAVNFPFVLNDINFEGLIPAGTPIAQVIPIKREDWEMSIGTQEEFMEQHQVTNRLNTKFFDRYKSMFRQPKVYK